MEFLNNITVYEITHASVIKFETNQKPTMNERAWHGIAFSLGGELYYTHNGQNIYLKDNRIVYLPKGSTYKIKCTKSGDFAIINFNVTDEKLYNEFVSIKTRHLDVLKKEFTKINDIIMSNKYLKRCDMLSAFYKIISVIVSDTVKSILPSPLTSAISFISDNLENPALSNTEIAAHIGISEVYLRKLFKNNLSIPVKQYIQDKRMEKAKKLLIETAMPVTEIAVICGYSCIYYFCRAFKQNTGYTPTEYKNKNKISLL